MDIADGILFLLLLAVALLCVDVYFWRKIVSKTAELTAVIDKAISVIQNPPVPQDVTPDSEIQPQIDRLQAALPQS